MELKDDDHAYIQAVLCLQGNERIQLHGPDSFAPGPNRFAVLAADGDDGSVKAQGKESDAKVQRPVPLQQQSDIALGSTRHRRGELVRLATAMPRTVRCTTHPGDCENSPSPIRDAVEHGRLVPDVTPSDETLRRGPNVEGYPGHVPGQGASGTNAQGELQSCDDDGCDDGEGVKVARAHEQ